MSKSHRQLQHKKSLSNTLYLHYQQHSRKLSNHSDVPLHIIAERGKKHYQHNQLPEALKYFEQVISANRKNVGEFIHEAWYLAAVIKMSKNQYREALKYLLEVYNKVRNYKQNTLFLLAICHNSLEEPQKSLEFLNIICQSDTNQDHQAEYSLKDAYFYRAKIQYKLQNYDQALSDVSKTIELGNNLNAVKLLYSQLLVKLGFKAEARQQIDALIKQSENLQETKDEGQQKSKKAFIKRIYNLKILTELQNSDYSKAQTYLNKSLAMGDADSQALYLKSKLHQSKSQFDQMILALNQCLNCNNHKKSVTQALQDLIAQSMDDRDFYQAFQYSKRMNFLKVDSIKLQALAKLAQGVTFLMKKKYGQSLLLLGNINPQIYLSPNKSNHNSKISVKKRDLETNMVNLYYNAMGYAYFCLGQFSNALKNYRQIIKNPDNVNHKAHYYNIALCEGIEAYQDDRIQAAIKLFENATDNLVRAEPYFYIAVILVSKNLPENADSDFFMKIIEIIESGLKINENSQMFYYRSLVYFYLGMSAEALDDIDKAVEKSEDNVAKYFYLRALIFFQQRNFEQAITEFTTCISIDENYYDAYLERAKVRLMNDEVDEAYEDLKMHPLSEDWHPLFLLHQGNYKQLLQLNKNKGVDGNIMDNAEFMLGNFEAAGPAGKIILAIMCSSYIQVDRILDDAIDIGFPVGCLDMEDLLLLKSYCLYKLNSIEQSVQVLERAESLLRKSGSMTYCEQEQKKLLTIKFNLILLTLKLQKYEEALQLCSNLINDVYQGKIYDELTKLREEIQEIIQQQGEVQQLTKNSELTLFKSEKMLSHCFPVQKCKHILFNFLIPYPKIKVLDIQIVPYEQPLLSFSLKDIQNKPEAPWMRRDKDGVIFTNCIHNFNDLNLVTQSNDNQGQQLAVDERQKIKEQLRLDSGVLKKLQKLSKEKEKQ